MLKSNENKTLVGTSDINNKTVVYFNAFMNNESHGITITIQDLESYNKNKKNVRDDIIEFIREVFKKEDEV